MKHKIAIFFENVRENFWLLPSIMVIVSIGMAIGLVYVDRGLERDTLAAIRVFYTGGAEGARELLSTVASAMMSVTGVTFSITIVALSIASSQFGPRLLRNFMRDTGNQIVLGTFVSTFIYCLLVLRTIRSAEEAFFVPFISVTIAILLAILSIGVLIYFMHHVSSSINAENVISLIQKDIEKAIEKLYPDAERYTADFEDFVDEEVLEKLEQKGMVIRAEKSGYVQGVDYDSLLNTAQSEDVIMDVKVRAGDFIDQDSEIIHIVPAKQFDEDRHNDLQAAVIIGARRARTQDVEYEINQLVGIAVRALSPSLNDPFTAMSAIDQLGAALSNMAERNIPPSYRHDENGDFRLLLNTVTFQGAVDTAFNKIRQYGHNSVSVLIRLLETLTIIGNHTQDPEKHYALKRQADLLWSSSQDAGFVKADLEDIRSRYLSLLKTTGNHEG
ncbi:MAG TPA: DUF2254 domain-containing protein [Anaerolineaceae bacterium]|nr:DUF2254 domain-containing protein [Anaerolineaceae bacterium]